MERLILDSSVQGDCKIIVMQLSLFDPSSTFNHPVWPWLDTFHFYHCTLPILLCKHFQPSAPNDLNPSSESIFERFWEFFGWEYFQNNKTTFLFVIPGYERAETIMIHNCHAFLSYQWDKTVSTVMYGVLRYAPNSKIKHFHTVRIPNTITTCWTI